MNTNKIAISGKMASGKSHVAKCLIELGYETVSLATPLKKIYELSKHSETVEGFQRSIEEAIELFFSMDYTHGRHMFREWGVLRNQYREEINSGEKPRLFLQSLGSMMLGYKSSCFIDYMIESTQSDKLYVCDDLRKKNEAEALKNNGWALVRCDVNEAVRKQRCLDLYGKFGEEQNHITEVDLDDWEAWDYMIDTGVPISEQKNEVTKMLYYLKTHGAYNA